jgi:hypothetical protein
MKDNKLEVGDGQRYVIMSGGDFLMEGADISFGDISWAGHRNLAATFTLSLALAMQKRFSAYREVEIVPWSNTMIFGKKGT